MAFVIDNPAPATIILITDDRNFVYPVSILRMRRYRVVLISPASLHTSLKQQASTVLDWDQIVRKQVPSADAVTTDLKGNAPWNNVPAITPEENTKHSRGNSFPDGRPVSKKQSTHTHSTSTNFGNGYDVATNRMDFKPSTHASSIMSPSSRAKSLTSPNKAVSESQEGRCSALNLAFSEPTIDIDYFLARARGTSRADNDDVRICGHSLNLSL